MGSLHSRTQGILPGRVDSRGATSVAHQGKIFTNDTSCFLTKDGIGLRGGGRERLALEGEPMKDIDKLIEKIESYKTPLTPNMQDYEWIDGFNHGLEWVQRILRGDKSAT